MTTNFKLDSKANVEMAVWSEVKNVTAATPNNVTLTRVATDAPACFNRGRRAVGAAAVTTAPCVRRHMCAELLLPSVTSQSFVMVSPAQ